MKKFIILLFLVSCVSPNLSTNPSNVKLDFNNDLSFDDFNKLLIEYIKTSPYPNIDKQIMKNDINIAIVGLGQVGIYLLNELNTKKKKLSVKQEKKLMQQLFLLETLTKKEDLT